MSSITRASSSEVSTGYKCCLSILIPPSFHSEYKPFQLYYCFHTALRLTSEFAVRIHCISLKRKNYHKKGEDLLSDGERRNYGSGSVMALSPWPCWERPGGAVQCLVLAVWLYDEPLTYERLVRIYVIRLIHFICIIVYMYPFRCLLMVYKYHTTIHGNALCRWI